jgi:hypothetical protein
LREKEDRYGEKPAALKTRVSFEKLKVNVVKKLSSCEREEETFKCDEAVRTTCSPMSEFTNLCLQQSDNFPLDNEALKHLEDLVAMKDAALETPRRPPILARDCFNNINYVPYKLGHLNISGGVSREPAWTSKARTAPTKLPRIQYYWSLKCNQLSLQLNSAALAYDMVNKLPDSFLWLMEYMTSIYHVEMSELYKQLCYVEETVFNCDQKYLGKLRKKRSKTLLRIND